MDINRGYFCSAICSFDLGAERFFARQCEDVIPFTLARILAGGCNFGRSKMSLAPLEREVIFMYYVLSPMSRRLSREVDIADVP